MVLPSAVGKLERRCARFSESVVTATKTKREEKRRKEGKEGADRTVQEEIEEISGRKWIGKRKGMRDNEREEEKEETKGKN